MIDKMVKRWRRVSASTVGEATPVNGAIIKYSSEWESQAEKANSSVQSTLWPRTGSRGS